MRSLILCGCFMILCSALGCSSSEANPYSTSPQVVTGKVRGAGGDLVRGGAEILLTPKAKENGIFGREGSSPVGPDGSFSLKTLDGQEGIPEGFYVVVVRPYGTNNAAKQAATRSIPKKYWSEDTSDMTVEITGSKTNWDIKLGN
ncbi:MAG: hypothetical protein K8U57_29940 [Planctomycetes bacterium]|nr:hypothetical protein [Planctomycetota bacterium]